MPDRHVCLDGAAAVLVFLENSLCNVGSITAACWQSQLVSTNFAEIENVQVAFFKALCDDPLEILHFLGSLQKTSAFDHILLEAQVACSKVDRHVSDTIQRLINALGDWMSRHCLGKSDLQACDLEFQTAMETKRFPI